MGDDMDNAMEDAYGDDPGDGGEDAGDTGEPQQVDIHLFVYNIYLNLHIFYPHSSRW